MTDRSMTPAEEMRFGCGPEETRPEGCTCRYSDGYIDAPAAGHDDDNPKCPLFECECGHALKHHGDRGCECERPDRWFPSKQREEAGGPCLCCLTPADIALTEMYGSLEIGRKIEAAQAARRVKCP